MNWQIWAGFVLSLFAFISYPLIFANWAETRDFPWANLALFLVAFVILFVGVKRAFGPGRTWLSKSAGVVLASIGVLSFGLFIFTAFVVATWLPESGAAPQAGRQAPNFTLTDQNGRRVSVSELLSTPIESQAGSVPAHPTSVLLIFYRGYW